MRQPAWAALLVIGCRSLSAIAQTEPAASGPSAPATVTVTGTRAAPPPVPGTSPHSVLTGPGLRGRISSTLGATLQDELGVGNASFGPNVGLPVIRGQGGSRTRMLQGGLGTHDASSVSADHGVMVEPALAEHIVVHRGPAAIRFGGSAIGGAVEIDEQRIPMRRPARLKARSEARLGTDGRLGLVRIDGPAGDTLAWHVDVHGRQSPRTRTRGWALDEDAIREQFQLVNGRNTWGRIDNTEARTEGGALALSKVYGEGAFGLSVSRLAQAYGIPPGAHSHGTDAPGTAPPEERVRIQALQRRVDFQGEFDLPWSADAQLRTRLTQVDYAHDELDAGRVTTRFSNRVLEGRLELDHPPLLGIAGTAGLQLQDRLFSALGAEAFVPQTRVRSVGVFAVEHIDWGRWRLDLGAVAEPGFGLRALYRSDAADPLQRLADYAARSRRLGEPSAQVTQHLLLELDAVQVDPRAVRAVVTGPGLPADGLVLHPPLREATSLPFGHWTVDPAGQQDWHGVQQGHCGEGVDAAACAAAWASLASGSAYRFVLLDAAGSIVDTLEAALPSPPIGVATLLAQRERWFGRWALDGQPLLQPTLARLMAGTTADGDALVLTQPWRGPSAARQRLLSADVEWHRAALPPADAAPQIVRQRWPIDGPGGALAGSLSAREGYRTIWLNLLLTSTDALGNRYLHGVSPDNPH